ncbi:helix-turn-helix domain-containing protein [Kitasatospora sp. NPDC101157]|uniref:helix-turn-helix domain-containing protein n=1 Tax=Kitasatospora sp. NPDC101157 TaxID=3364098 RepID=UPI0037FDCE9A
MAAENGGLPPERLPEPSRSDRYLSLLERKRIATLRERGLGIREIAGRLGRSPSTVSRELRRNTLAHDQGIYDADLAHHRAEERVRRPRLAKLRPGWARPSDRPSRTGRPGSGRRRRPARWLGRTARRASRSRWRRYRTGDRADRAGTTAPIRWSRPLTTQGRSRSSGERDAVVESAFTCCNDP